MGWKLNRLRARGRKQSRRSRGIRYRFQPRRRRRGATCLHIRVALWKIRTGHIWLTDLPHRGLIMFRYMVRILRRSPFPGIHRSRFRAPIQLTHLLFRHLPLDAIAGNLERLTSKLHRRSSFIDIPN